MAVARTVIQGSTVCPTINPFELVIANLQARKRTLLQEVQNIDNAIDDIRQSESEVTTSPNISK